MEQLKSKAVEYSLTSRKCEFNKAKVASSLDASNYARQFYFDDLQIYESSFVILLNQANTAIGYAKISQGGICGTVVDLRIVCKYAIECLATGVILVHNHPSGNLSPSRQDDDLTSSLKKALETLNIKLLDHVIITEESYYSYLDRDRL